MAMILGPIYLLGIAFYVFLYKKLRKRNFGVAKSLLITFIATLPFTYDIVVTNILSAYYCRVVPPHPKTKIEKKVEYPISIYWEDNVYPGFSEEDRELMIINYLDGKHLKTMVLNGNDGKIYLYHLDKPIWKEFKESYQAYIRKHPPKKDRFRSHGFDIYKAYAKEIMKSEMIYGKNNMPETNYTVTFNEIKLNGFASKFLYSDETKIIENKTGKVIAYNRRYMRFFYNLFPDTEVGGMYYDKTPMCGKRISLPKVTFEHNKWNFNNMSVRWTDINQKLYKKYIKGEK